MIKLLPIFFFFYSGEQSNLQVLQKMLQNYQFNYFGISGTYLAQH